MFRLVLALSTLALAPALRAQSSCGGWTPGLANPRWTQESTHINNWVPDGLFVFDTGTGPRLHISGFDANTFSPTGRSLRRWNGQAFEPLDPSGVGALITSALPARLIDLGSGAQLYASYSNSTTAFVQHYAAGAWSTVGAPIAGDEVVDLCAHDAGGGPQLFALLRPLSGTGLSKVLRFDGASWTQLGPAVGVRVNALRSLDDGGGPALYVLRKEDSPTTQAVQRWNGSSWTNVGALTRNLGELFVHDFGSGPVLYAAPLIGASGQALLKLVGGSWVPAVAQFGWTSAVLRADLGSGPQIYVFGNFSGGAISSTVRTFDGTSLATPPGAFTLDYAVTIAAEVPGPGGNRIALAGSFGFETTPPADRFSGGFLWWDGASTQILGRGMTYRLNALGSMPGAGGRRLVAAGDANVPGGGPAGSHLLLQAGPSFVAMFERAGGEVLALGSVDLGAGEQIWSGRLIAPVYTLSHWGGVYWVGESFTGSIYALEPFTYGGSPHLIVGGNFTVAGNYIAAFNGTSWSAFGAGTNNLVTALVVHDEGAGAQLFAGGLFTLAGGQPANRIARWNGSAWSALGTGILDGAVSALRSFDDGNGAKLYVGGSFTNAAGVTVSNLALWNGSSWSNVHGGGPNGAVLALCVHDDGRGPALYVGGGFSSIGGITAFNIARFDGSSWEAVAGGTNNVVRALHSIDDDGDGDAELFLAGDFTQVGEVASGFVARLEGCPHYQGFCFGDGLLADHTTPCPCGNNGLTGRGCANSLDPNGALLGASGGTNPDTLVLAASGMPLSALGLYLQHDALGDRLFHDGVLCAGGNLIRLRTRAAVNGSSRFPDSTDTVTVSQRGQVSPGSGATRYCAVYYRNASPTFCPPATANVTNGVRVIW